MSSTLLLWPNGAPGACGCESADTPTITPYLVKRAQPTAAVVVCPGGGYRNLAPHEGEPIALWLNSIGVSAVVLKYRIAPYQYPCSLQDAQRAIRLVRHQAANWGIDPGKVGILGFSAGGHLASTAGTHFDRGVIESDDPVERHSCRPDFMILCYPVITFGELHSHIGSIRNLLGTEPAVELRELLSNEKQVTSDTPPAFLWHTADDPGVPVENSLMLATALRKHRVPFALHVFQSGRHGMGLAGENPDAQAWPALCASWLRSSGFIPKDGSAS